MSKTVYISIP